MGDVNELKKERNKTMANLPGSIKNLNTLLGEQLTEGGGGGGGGFTTAKVKVVGKARTTFFGSEGGNYTPINGLLEHGDHFYRGKNFGDELV